MDNLQIIQNKIYEIRGQEVMLDRDLATLYCVETKNLNKAVSRNPERFPEYFMFQLTKEECLRFQIGTLNNSAPKQGRGQHLKFLPYAFTEQGVSMLSSVLRSKIAVQTSIAIMNAFVQMRAYLTQSKQVTAELDDLHRRMLALEQLPTSSNRPLLNTDEPLPDYLSERSRIFSFSDRELIILTDDSGDIKLLENLGARYNRWLIFQEACVAGWLYPKARMEILEMYILERRKRIICRN